MPLACEQQQAIKVVQKRLGTSLFVAESFTFGPPDFSLNRILLEHPKEVGQSGTEIQDMKANIPLFCIRGSGGRFTLSGRISMYLSSSLSSVCSREWKIALPCSGLSTRGSQWSAKGNETILRPVSQLLTRQKTIPFVNMAPGGEVV